MIPTKQTRAWRALAKSAKTRQLAVVNHFDVSVSHLDRCLGLPDFPLIWGFWWIWTHAGLFEGCTHHLTFAKCRASAHTVGAPAHKEQEKNGKKQNNCSFTIPPGDSSSSAQLHAHIMSPRPFRSRPFRNCRRRHTFFLFNEKLSARSVVQMLELSTCTGGACLGFSLLNDA
jgi:hypothetical protein